MTEYPNSGGRFYRDPDTGVISKTPPEQATPAEVKTPSRSKGAQAPVADETKEN